MKRTCSLLLVVAALVAMMSGCQSINSAMTPSSRVSTDPFDGTTTVTQPPVSAAASLTEDWHTLGFEWTARTPNQVFLTPGVQGIDNIFGLEFNVAGRMISASSASLTTDYADWSTRRFVVSYQDFVTIATAPIVKMKVSGANSYGVSSFGTGTSALVSKKLPTFLQQVQAARGAKGR